MNHEQDRDFAMQHEAEHEKPGKKLSVMSYLTILFAAAFLLLLLTFFMQQRTSTEALGNQQTITVNAMKSIEELQADNETLQQQVDDLNRQLEALKSDYASLESGRRTQNNALNELQTQYSALTYLNQIRALYNQRQYADARAVIAQADQTLADRGGMEGVLTAISQGLTAEELELYDPLDAYQSLVDWLN